MLITFLLVSYLIYSKNEKSKKVATRNESISKEDPKDEPEKKELVYSSVIKRSILTQLQVLSMVGKFDFPWTSFIKSFFVAVDAVASVGVGSTISINGGLKCWYQSAWGEMPLPFIELLMSVLSFCLLLLVVLVFWKAHGYATKDWANSTHMLTVSIIVISFLAYSSLSRSFFQGNKRSIILAHISKLLDSNKK